MSKYKEVEWNAADITDHVQRFKLDGGELFIKKFVYDKLILRTEELECEILDLKEYKHKYEGLCK